MRTVGINVAADTAYLSVVDDGELLEAEPYLLRLPRGLDGARALLGLRDDVAKVLTTHGVNRLRVLDAEANSNGSYASLKDRLSIETTFMLAAAEHDIDAGRLTRAQVRSILSLPREGALKTHAAAVCSPSGPYWSGKRDIAAMAAIAAGRE
ncbi:hypothetical protein ACFQE5_17615 [Pseudonocardia hispaniensis]|uniref:Uncharacterized protein n=1 Tax=Pseudonocardia hispaniensis TaxID=904933 RepID=A0ABW1J5A0_9PSEU